MSVSLKIGLIFLGISSISSCRVQQKFPVVGGVAAAPPPELQFFAVPPSNLDATASVTDLSSLTSEPAGAHGFVRVSGAHFVDDRSERLRFFGINLTGVAALPDRDTADRLARHFRKLGFNAARLEALDAPQGIVGSDGELVPSELAKLDHFVAALKAQGIYVALGLHALAGYPGLEGDALAHFPQGRVLDRFHRPFLEAQKNFARRLLTHENPETHASYAHEPALLYVELNDEDTIFPAWAGSPDDAPASYRAELAQRYAPWLAERTAEGLRAPGPALEEAAHELPTFQSAEGARADYAQFLRQVELDSVRELTSYVRQELALQSLLVNTQVSFGGLAGVLREAELSDFIDAHGYWDHPRPSSDGQWSLQNTPQFAAADGGTLGVLAGYRVFGKPFVVSEYASATPNDYAAEALPLLLGIAGLQDWDALFAFAWADQKRDYDPGRINGVFDLAGNPAKLAFLSTAALAFRKGLVAPGASRVELFVPDAPTTLPVTEAALSSLWSANNVPLAAAALRQVGISLHSGASAIAASYALHVSGALGSDTGELYWESSGEHPRFSIDAPALEAVCGQVAKSSLKFADFSLEFADFAEGFACATLVSADGQPLARANRVLFTVTGRSQNSQRPKNADRTRVEALGAGPALAQFIPVTLGLPNGAWHAAALSATGAPKRVVPITVNGAPRLTTSLEDAALTYSLTR